MKFKKNAKVVTSGDQLYDLFHGGYIKPEDILCEEDAEKVNAAVETIKEFLSEMEENGLIEEM